MEGERSYQRELKETLDKEHWNCDLGGCERNAENCEK